MKTTSYEIPAENLDRLVAKLDTLAKKAIKLGFEAPTYTIGAAYEREVTRRSEANDFCFDGEEELEFNAFQEFVTYHTVTVSGSAPKIDGWHFAAVCDYADEPVIIRALSDVTIPVRYRTIGAVCEHCKLDRKRHECCILSHENGDFIQVGKSCLKDFLGHKSPERLAEMAEALRDAEDDCRECGSSNATPDPSLVTVLTWASSVVARLGWCPKSKEDFDALTNPNGRIATSTTVNGQMSEYARCLAKRLPYPYPMPTKGDNDRALAAIEFAKTLPGNSDYELNVLAIVARCGVSDRNFGIAVSIMGSYDREMAKRTERADRAYVGTVGKKVNCICTKKACKCAPIKVLVARVVSLPENKFGVSYINIMRDVSGNTLVWKSSTCLSTGSEYHLTGKVKDHTDKYGKQTDLSHCKAEIIESTVNEGDAIAA